MLCSFLKVTKILGEVSFVTNMLNQYKLTMLQVQSLYLYKKYVTPVDVLAVTNIKVKTGSSSKRMHAATSGQPHSWMRLKHLSFIID